MLKTSKHLIPPSEFSFVKNFSDGKLYPLIKKKETTKICRKTFHQFLGQSQVSERQNVGRFFKLKFEPLIVCVCYTIGSSVLRSDLSKWLRQPFHLKILRLWHINHFRRRKSLSGTAEPASEFFWGAALFRMP